ncbi:MAG: glycyl radical protein, partial [Deltaproteobacteria bacterium]|nr:glycyl radical protein [Deltaproteobacteria bacterium]
LKEYKKLPTRSIDPFAYSEEDRKELEDMVLAMNRDSLRKKVFNALSREEKSLFLADPDNDPNTVTNVFALDSAINGPGGHINPDYQTVLEIGLSGIRERAEQRMEQAAAEKDQPAIDFLNAAIISIDAMGVFAKRYSDLAKELAAKEHDKTRKFELLRMADACARVPMQPAQSFYEACQSLWLLFIGIEMEGYQKCYSVGRFDQFAYPYYKHDIENKVITLGEAQEMVDCLFLKFPETNHVNSESYNQSAAGFPAQQQFCCGGQTVDGKDASNDLTIHCLQASINTRFHQPSISLRVWKGTPDKVIRKACELARLGTGHPSFFCDDTIISSLQSKGVSLADARDYGIVGCSGVQPTRKDKGAHNAGYLNIAACLEFTLLNGHWRKGSRKMGIDTGDPTKFKTFEEFMRAYREQTAYLINVYTGATIKAEEYARDLCPTPFLSTFVQDCITRARDRSAGGAWYNSGCTARAVGLATVADSLAVIKKLVYEEKKFTMAELLKAMDADFKGYDDMLHMINSVPKYGNDDDYVDNLAREVTDFYSEETDKYRALFGGRFHPGFSSISANVPYGWAVGATPDGRKAFTPLSDGASPAHHMDKEGPTAVALSSAKLNHKGMSGGSILNIKFSPSTVKGDKGLDKFVSFVKGAIAAGIWHMQFNIVDTETLRDAQTHPDKYPDLLVRVAGYSAFFCGLPECLQDDVIDRSVHVI